MNGWEDMPTRDSATSTSYKLEWWRWPQMRVKDFLAFQAAIVRKSRAPGQFVTQDYGSMMKLDVNEFELAKALDIVANNLPRLRRTISTEPGRRCRATFPLPKHRTF